MVAFRRFCGRRSCGHWLQKKLYEVMRKADIPSEGSAPLPPPINPDAFRTGEDAHVGHVGQRISLCPPGGAPGIYNNTNVMEMLVEQGYTSGLAEAVLRSKETFQLCIWIVDNSGSMKYVDGHRIVSNEHQQLRLVECTRWAEMQQTVEYHALLAGQLQSPTIFRYVWSYGYG